MCARIRLQEEAKFTAIEFSKRRNSVHLDVRHCLSVGRVEGKFVKTLKHGRNVSYTTLDVKTACQMRAETVE